MNPYFVLGLLCIIILSLGAWQQKKKQRYMKFRGAPR